MSFIHWAHYIIGIEKPYANVEGDSGGETFYGFTTSLLQQLEIEPPRDKETAIEYLDIYFWKPLSCDDLDWFVAWCYADAVFHHGLGKSANKCLQAGLGVAQDGIVGPVTMAAGKTVRRTDFWLRYARRRNRLFIAIARHRKKDMKFIQGWFNRLHELSTTAYRSIGYD